MLHKYLFRFTPRQRDISHYLIVAFPFGWTGGPARSFPCWVEVLEQVSPAGSTWKLIWIPVSVPVTAAPGSPRAVASPVGSTWNLTWNPVSVPVALAPGGPARSFPCWVEVLEQVSTWNLTWNPVSAPVAAAPGGPTRSFPCWLEECNLEPGKCPRLRRPEAPPGAPARSFPCWVEVLEQVSPAGSTWNLTWSPLSVPVALAPGGSNKSKLTMNL